TGGGHHLPHGRLVRHVGPDGQGAGSARPRLLRHLLRRRLADRVVDHHVVAAAGQGQRRRPADPPRRPGHQRDPPAAPRPAPRPAGPAVAGRPAGHGCSPATRALSRPPSLPSSGPPRPARPSVMLPPLALPRLASPPAGAAGAGRPSTRSALPWNTLS